MENSLTVSIIGRGNVATHLWQAFRQSDKPTRPPQLNQQAEADSPAKINAIIVNPHTLEELPEHSDIIIISVKDSVIREVAEKVCHRADIIAHTSGSVPMSVLEGMASGWGVFYPLQTFTKGVELNYGEIPFFIEGDSEHTFERLAALAGVISRDVTAAGSEERKKLHLASVFACNFTNCLMGISREILADSGISYKVMLPLLRQTISKLSLLTPTEAQTGPAARGDRPVMEAHLNMLADKPELQEIYRLLSDVIIKNKEKELNEKRESE